MDGVIPGTAVNDGFHVFTGTENINLIGSAAAVNFDGFDIHEVGDSAGTGNIGIGNNKNIPDGRADHHDGVDSGSAVYFNRGILQVIIPVCTRSAEQFGQVGHLIGIVRILLQHQECLQQEGVIPRPSVQIQPCPVVVDFHTVILAFSENEQGRGVAIGHIVGICNRHAFGVLQIPVAGIRNERHGSHNDLVITAAHVNHGNHGRIVREKGIITGVSVNGQAIDLPESDGIAFRAGNQGGGHMAHPVGTASRRIQFETVGTIRAVDDQFVKPGDAAVTHVEYGSGVRDIYDNVFLQGVLVISPVVDGDLAGPLADGHEYGALVDGSVPIADHDNVIARSAGNDRLFENPVEVFHNGGGIVVIAGHTEFEVGIILFYLFR